MWEYALGVGGLIVGLILYGFWQARQEEGECEESSCEQCSKPETCGGFSFHRKDLRP